MLIFADNDGRASRTKPTSDSTCLEPVRGVETDKGDVPIQKEYFQLWNMQRVSLLHRSGCNLLAVTLTPS